MLSVQTSPVTTDKPLAIDAGQLRDVSAPVAHRHRLQAPSWNHRAPLLDGFMHLTEIQPGMLLRVADVHDRYDLTSRAELPAGVKIALVLDGNAHVRFGGRAITLGRDEPATDRAVAVTLARPERFVRNGRAGGHERTVTLTLTPAWLAANGYAWQPDPRTPPHLTRWTPSPGLLGLLEGVIDPGVLSAPPRTRQLRLTGAALSLAGEALAAAFDGVTATGTEAPVTSDRRLRRLIRLIDGGAELPSTQARLAARLGMSLSSLQRQFRSHYGMPLGRYLRRRRLAAAGEAIRQRGMNMETAANLAGYTSAANFATAFRREFGMPPSRCRGALQAD
ncbi:HTH-type transcriptional activator RhaS [wastewater metagenome]|uniref:HTH-type transcriptional activator RhaS n=3 Tax=root TaxID=1 RepID=A0A5B8RGD4_9ZZZZ|nr:HTH-type transcriptional activator RhaS [uncultured organism]